MVSVAKRMRTIIAVVALIVALPATMENLEAGSPGRYQMLVNHGAGWSEGGGFRTLVECKREAALYAVKHSAQAGCVEESAMRRQATETRFRQTAASCAALAGVRIIHKPGAKATILGTAKERFEFDDCMASRGEPTQ